MGTLNGLLKVTQHDSMCPWSSSSCERALYLGHLDNYSLEKCSSSWLLKGKCSHHPHPCTWGSLRRPSHWVSEPRTCDDVPDGLHQCCEARDFGLPVLPHGLPYNKPAGQSEREVRFLGEEKIYVRWVATENWLKGPVNARIDTIHKIVFQINWPSTSSFITPMSASRVNR